MSRLLDYVLNVESTDIPWASYPWNSTTRKRFAQDMYPCIQQSSIGKDITALLTEGYSEGEIMHESIDFGMINMTRMEALSLYNNIIAYSFADIAHKHWTENITLTYYTGESSKGSSTHLNIDISTLTLSAFTLIIFILKFIIFLRTGREFIPI